MSSEQRSEVGAPDAAPAHRRHVRDLTTGPITRTLLTFALPMFGMNILQSLNATVNQFWVSHSLGVNAITAIGNSNIVMMMMLGSIFGVSLAANILVAHAVGAKNYGQVKKVMGSASTFFISLTLLISLVGGTLAPHILSLMGTPPAAKAEAVIYLRIVFMSMPSMCLFVFLQMAQRAVGDARSPFYFALVAVTLDIILNPLLIRGIGPFPRLGIAGSATSTLIGQSISLTCLVFTLYRRKSPLVLHWNELHLLKPDFEIIRSLGFRGLPMGAQMLVMSGSAMMMIGMVNHYGAVTAAAYTAASQVWTYVQMPGMALGQSVSSMAAQNVGAERWDRVGQIARSGVISGLLITGSVAAIIYALGDTALRLFLPAGSEALPVAHHMNIMVLWSFVLFSITFSLTGIVRSTGAVWPPLLSLFFSMWLIRAPFAKILIPYLGPDAIWWSFPMGALASSMTAAAYYRWGGWRKLRMLRSESEPHGQAADVGMALPAMDVPPEDEETAAEFEAERRARLSKTA